MNKLKIALTSGDVDGIGLEVASKALQILGPQRGVQFILWRDRSAPSRDLRRLKEFNPRTVVHLQDALEDEHESLIDIASDLAPPFWVQQSAVACLKKQISGMATGPLSKTSIQEAGLKDLGHTDILKRVAKTSSVHMSFVGEHFNVLLATAHIPLASVTRSLSQKSLEQALINANSLRLLLPRAQSQRPIGILGLNPHAGEQGLIGSEELRFFPDLLKFAKSQGVPIAGPLVPDAAFFPRMWKKYSVFLALYHDQGLIPFKMIHGQDSGVHISMGLPFIRTSVDHGTAKDIFGQNRANPASMTDAIRWCISLAKKSR